MFFLKKIPLSIITLTSLCLTAMLSWAQEQPQPAEPTSVIPYQGTLFSQGKPVSQTDPIKMAFAIYSDSTGLDAGASADAPALHRKWTSWSSTENVDDVVNADRTIDVQVRNGRFLAHLGEEEHGQQPLKDSTFTPDPPADDFYVITWVVKDSGGVFRLPPQKLGKVPHAVTAERALDFEVQGVLKVDHIQSRTLDGLVEVRSALRLRSGTETHGVLLNKVSIRRESTEVMNSPQNFDVTAECEDGEVVISGGMDLTGGNYSPNDIFYKSSPDGNGWRIVGYNGRSDEVKVRAHAVCVKVQ